MENIIMMTASTMAFMTFVASCVGFACGIVTYYLAIDNVKA